MLVLSKLNYRCSAIMITWFLKQSKWSYLRIWDVEVKQLFFDDGALLHIGKSKFCFKKTVDTKFSDVFTQSSGLSTFNAGEYFFKVSWL